MPLRQERVWAAGSSIEDIIAAAERDRGSAGEEHQGAQAKGPEFKSRPPKSQPVLVAKSEPPTL